MDAMAQLPLPAGLGAGTFPAKLWSLVNDLCVWSLRWDSEAQGLLVDRSLFERELLRPGGAQGPAPNAFRATQFSSFVRQLYRYGFRKVPGRAGAAAPGDAGAWLHYTNPWFRRDHPDLLLRIRRRSAANTQRRAAGPEGRRRPPCGSQQLPRPWPLPDERHGRARFQPLPRERPPLARRPPCGFHLLHRERPGPARREGPSRFQELYGEWPLPAERELLRVPPCHFQGFHGEQLLPPRWEGPRSRMQELYGEQPPPLDRELLWMQPCSFQQLHREQQPPASNPPAAAGTSAPHAPAGSAGCAASTASSSAQNAPAQEESPALDLGQAIEKMIREIRNSLPVKAPSAQGNINVAPESPGEDPMNRAAAEEASSGTESCGNSSPEPEEPVVPNPYTLLSKVPPQHQWFSVVDLKDAFWACPLAKESRDTFVFEWEDPKTGRKQQLRWTKLPQGFTESPNLFGQALEKILQAFSTPPRIQIIQYVDDLLLSGEDEVEVREATIKLLNFLRGKGLRVSKGKLQFVEPEVKYFGHLISKGSRRLSLERIAGILSLPPPSSKREIRKLLGLLGYCRLWIEGYTQTVKFLYEKLTEGDNKKWTKEDNDKLEKLKLKLASIPALSLPSLEKPFHLYVNVEKGVAHGVLVQEWGGVKRPVAYLSKMLDPVSHGWPVCIQAIAATAILVEEKL
ncbi:hypothetical protein DUI87_20815 [Hirundo rustica rustica]|uniref:ribonuclease H n=1 Tax=Hirundo rustica rustica TaxID=333673 RepID=A0A3M0JN88_HIRRU|nr:hypothetical protein DUI87_20815 [Hirundo rustica rustica]